MGRHRINEEDRVQTLGINVKGYVRDNIYDDPEAMKEILAFIEEKWGYKDVEKYEQQRRAERIEWLERNLEIEIDKLTELRSKHGVSSELFIMMSTSIIKKLAEFENELKQIKGSK